MTPEFSRRVARQTIGDGPQSIAVEADAKERAALAKRFDLMSLDLLAATAVLVATAKGVEARGTVRARVGQACVVTGDAVMAAVNVPFALRFVEALPDGEAEIELSDSDCDILPLDDGQLDLGEAVAQTLCLALDPFPRSAAARAGDERIWSVGPQGGAFAGLAALLPKDQRA